MSTHGVCAGDGGKYVTKAFLIITGIRDDRNRETLGAMITDNENEGFWTGFFDELKDRGLKGVELVVSDGHKEFRLRFHQDFLCILANMTGSFQ
jgi:transposase-like protein